MCIRDRDDGVLAKILVPAGTEVAVGAPVMVVVEDEGDAAAFGDFVAPAAAAAAPPAPAPAPAPAAAAEPAKYCDKCGHLTHPGQACNLFPRAGVPVQLREYAAAAEAALGFCAEAPKRGYTRRFQPAPPAHALLAAIAAGGRLGTAASNAAAAALLRTNVIVTGLGALCIVSAKAHPGVPFSTGTPSMAATISSTSTPRASAAQNCCSSVSYTHLTLPTKA